MPPTPTQTLQPNPAAAGVPTLAIEGDQLAISRASQPRSYPLADIGIASFRYRIRNTRTSGLLRHNVMVESRAGTPLAWLGNLDVDLYPPGALASFADRARLPLRDLGEIPSSVALSFPDEVRIGPGTSRMGGVVAPLRQWILCLALIGGATPLALSFVEHWSLWWWLLLVPLWLFGSFFAVGALQGGTRKDDRAWVARTRVKATAALLLTGAGSAAGALGYQGRWSVPGWVGFWVGSGGLILLSGWLLALQGATRRP